ncbi:uncharacterized protein ACLA_093290 [Aspergillus clavatus NRRL 1]|uniref:Uncharacterized protein n=1 Tax=Aspergillus clavatus (strain ATCC 1007 / CBS 513.65 / DSM 816 / NCTC 3887 / NRRL 1 / QM 1276 / 107) TaxID=344612 RepID=A1CFI1_ASPCL|nr:uncharacterized protein ACLA_093290 [Aspergillus clavatus NRRL 1]EAW11630.1 conserved hypothetical protein [Aspergillus clavatus NRRL 1]
MFIQRGTGSVSRPGWLLLTLLVVILPSTVAQFCTFWDGGCVDPLAQTAVTFDFPPLFLDDITLYYGFDANPSGKGQDPMIKASFWLRYDANRIDNSVIHVNRTSEIAFRVGNLTGTPSGGSNGCEGVWGQQCTDNLRDLLKGAFYELSMKGESYSYPLQAVLNKMLAHPPFLSNCPPQFFSDLQSLPVQPFAQETEPDKTATIQTPGFSGSPWKTWFIDNVTSSQQAEQVAVAVISRAPTFNGHPLHSKDDVQIEFVCIQAPSSGGSSSTKDG